MSDKQKVLYCVLLNENQSYIRTILKGSRKALKKNIYTQEDQIPVYQSDPLQKERRDVEGKSRSDEDGTGTETG